MTNEQNTVSRKEASEALDSIVTNKHRLIETQRPPILLTLLASISYAAIIFGYGMTEHENLWALAMWLGGLGFAISVGLYYYTYRVLGVKLNIIPKSSTSIWLNLITGLVFAVLLIGGRELRLTGFEYAPHLAALLAGIILFTSLKKYPTGEYVEEKNNDNS